MVRSKWGPLQLGNPALEQMLPPGGRSQFYLGLNDQWKHKPVGAATEARPFISCAYENLDTMHVRIVTWASGTRLCDDGGQPVLADHIDIVKPDSRHNLAYQTLANALARYAFTTTEVSTSASVDPRSAPSRGVIPPDATHVPSTQFPDLRQAKLLQDLMDDLCDRGVLKNPGEWERIGPTRHSLEQIHEELSDVLKTLPVGSAARAPTQKMRAAALHALQNPILLPQQVEDLALPLSEERMGAIDELRTVFSVSTRDIVRAFHLVGNCRISPGTEKAALDKGPPQFVRYFDEYPDANPSAPVCMDRDVPKGVPIVVSMAGSWSEMNNGKCTALSHCRQGPVVWPPTIVGMSAGKPLYSIPYTHPTTVLARSTGYKVCVQMPTIAPGSTFLMTSGDPLKMSVIDARDYERQKSTIPKN